jgi:hypothetical protein
MEPELEQGWKEKDDWFCGLTILKSLLVGTREGVDELS